MKTNKPIARALLCLALPAVFFTACSKNKSELLNETGEVKSYSSTDAIELPELPFPTGYKMTFQTGYDSDADLKYGGNGQAGEGRISTTTYRTPTGSFYSIPANVSSGIRSEVQYTGADQNPKEGAIEYDVLYEVIVPNNGHSLQWHPNTPGSSGSPHLLHENGKFTWMNWKNGVNERHPTNVTIQAQRWYHMRVEFKFGPAGYLRHYIDGNQVCSWNGQVGDDSGQYLKLGYNGWDANSYDSRIYYDNLKVYAKAGLLDPIL